MHADEELAELAKTAKFPDAEKELRVFRPIGGHVILVEE